MIETLSEEECTTALLRELRWGRQVKESFQQIREAEAAKEAIELRGHRTIPGLGKCVVNMPAHEFFLMREKYGDDCWGDRGFIKDFQRLEPTMAVHKA